MSYAYADRAVWLEELASEAHPMVHDLCRAHAATIRVPRGWHLNDQWSGSGLSGTHGHSAAEPDRLDLVGA